MVSGGINIIPCLPVAQMVEIGQEAERLGYDRFWIMDEGLAARDAYITMTAIAQNTNTILLGTGITNPYTRHPAITAASIATLYEYSEGRAILGIGAGGSLTLDPLDIQRRKPLTAVREMVETTRSLFKGDTVTYKGDIIQLSEARIEYARPEIEIWIAGRGPKMLSLGGRIANGVSFGYNHKELIQENIDLIMNGAGLSGNKPMLSYATIIITNDRMLRIIKPYLVLLIVDSPPKAKEIIGVSEEEINTIRRTMGSQGLHEAGKLLKDEWISPFVVMGSKSECISEIKTLVSRYEIDELLLPIFDISTAQELMEDMAEALVAIN